MKSFLKDADGLSIRDLEKVVTCLLFVVVTLAIVYEFLFNSYVDVNMTVFDLGLGGLFVVRKAFKYNLDKSTLSNVTESTESEGESGATSTPTI